MTIDALRDYRCPDCGAELHLDDGGAHLECLPCQNTFHIVNGIPRFVSSENYAENFGFEWNRHSRTQMDSANGTSISRDRFFGVSRWPLELEGERIMEAGCGAGRFTQQALSTGADVFSFDYSNAVDANRAVNGHHPHLRLSQADIYRIPFATESFDRVFCLGVLQHCPDPKGAFRNLLRYVRPGGQLVIDIYHSKPRDWINPAVWLRGITTRMSSERLYRLVQRVVPALLPAKVWMTEHLPFGRYVAFFIPIVSHRGVLEGADKLSWTELIDWAVLDTFDHYSPKYDRGATLRTVQQWVSEADLVDAEVRYGPNGIVARGTKRA